RRRHTRSYGDWSSDVCSSDLKDGQTLVLTVDQTVQFIVERELAAAVEKTQAKSGAAVVLDPRTGEILALANAPAFDPNDAGGVSADARRNGDRKSTRLNSSHRTNSYAVFCLKK